MIIILRTENKNEAHSPIATSKGNEKTHGRMGGEHARNTRCEKRCARSARRAWEKLY